MRIDYRVRPNKVIERKMLAQGLQRLDHLEPLSNYRYVGFGSIFFADFRLFHKQLGIQPMISIEKDIDNIERYRYNSPFSCVKVMPGKSGVVIPKLSWTTPNIVWLDYTDAPNGEILTDIAYLCEHLVSHSILIVSVNADPSKLTRKGTSFEVMRDALVQRVGEPLPFAINASSMIGWELAATYRKLLVSEIQSAIAARNALGDPRVAFQQVFNFVYADGAQMLTIGGVIHADSDAEALAGCCLSDLGFYRDGEQQYRIDAPNLTPRELLALNSCLPSGNGSGEVPVTASEKALLAPVYRYYPTFSETDL
jgi:hypothetical protein